MRRVRLQLLDVRRGERRDVAVAVATLFTFMVAHGILETARDALFLSRLPAERLPWVYLGMAVVGVLLAGWSARWGRETPGPRRLCAILGISAIITACLAAPDRRSITAFLRLIAPRHRRRSRLRARLRERAGWIWKGARSGSGSSCGECVR